MILLVIICSFLTACATKNLVRYEKSTLVEKGKDFKETQLPKQFNAYILRDGDCSGVTSKGTECTDLSIRVMLNNPIQEEWKDIYSRMGIYETRCKGWKDQAPETQSFGSVYEETKYCEINWKNFWTKHLFVIGFLYDIAIPFLPYSEKVIQTEEADSGLILEPKSNIRNNEIPISADTIKLTIDQKTINSPVSDGIAKFSLKSFKLSAETLPENSKVMVEFESQKIDLSEAFSSFARSEKMKRSARIEAERGWKVAQEIHNNKPEVKFKIPYCANRDILNVISYSNPVVSNCIYELVGYPLKVLQVIDQGILVTFNEMIPNAPSAVFLIKTKKEYVDNDSIRDMLVQSAGTFKYTTTLGAIKTIRAFQHLDSSN